MIRLKTILILLLALTAWTNTNAIEVYSRKLNTAGGLPDNNVRNLGRDAKGYIWMGTPTGLFRYDGYFFNIFRSGATDAHGYPGNDHIEGCHALDDGRMLFREKGGTCSVFDVGQNRFADLPDTTKQGLYEQVRQRRADSLVLRPYSDILSHGGSYINDNLGNVIVIDNAGHIWFIDRNTRETIKLSVFDERLFPLISSHKYKVLTSEQKGLIWVSTNGCGITLYDRRSSEERHIRQESGLISTDYILDICLDQNGDLWAADEFHGVVHLTTERDAAEAYLLEPQSRELRINQVYLMKWTADSTLLIANTKGDVYEADRQMHLRRTMTGIDMHAACIDSRGQLWIGSRQQGYRSPEGQWHRHADSDAAAPSADNITTMLCDADDNVWIGCEEGRLDLVVSGVEGLQVRHFLPMAISPKFIAADSRGTLWVGSAQGLFSFVPSQLIADSTAYRQYLPEVKNDYNCFFEDRQHNIWIGTDGSGLYRTADWGGTFRQITMADGLIANNVQSLIAPDDSTLWIATRQGITCYSTNDGRCQYIYNEHSLLQNYYANNCVSMLPDRRVAFGTNQGIVVYHPERRLAAAEPTAALRITDLLINGESVGLTGGDSPLNQSPDNSEEVRLNHDQNTLTIRFSTFNFNTTAATRYTYRLDGYDNQWSEMSTYSFANYAKLRPGRYVFHVKAFDNHLGSNLERSFTIIIRHPWWQTWWACLIYTLLAIALGWFVYRQLRTVYTLRRRISIEQQLTEYKLQFFTNISHEFRTPLTIIRGAIDRMTAQQNVPANLRQPISAMQKSTARMLRLINQLLEFRKMQNNKLRLALQETDVVAFVKDICDYFNEQAEGKKIGFTFLPSVKSYTMFIDRQHVDKMVFNLLSNAFKYTPTGGDVSVRLKISDDALRIIVADTGVGIPREKQAELFQRFMQSTFSADSIGIGLHLTRALVEVHHGQIGFEENQPRGSVFTITLPTDRQVYADSDFLQESDLKPAATATEGHRPVYQEMMAEPMNDRRVLVVEDDADVADYLKQVLGRYFEVDVAMDGAAALDKIAAEQPDLIVSDVMMPLMDGFELTKKIRSNTATQHIPIILLTALTAEDKRLKGIEKGADAYLTKPFDEQLLVATCRQLIEQRDKLRQSFADAPPERMTAPPEIIVDERDKQLLDTFNRWLYDRLNSPTLSVDEVAQALGYGRSVFYRKIKSLTGQTPADYIRTLRMNRAAELLRDETITVAEVAYKVGINEPHYFTRVFKQQFGISPKKYQQGVQSE